MDIAAIATALAGLLAALAQWAWLVGPRRNGQRARLHTIEARLSETENALHHCLRSLHRVRRREQRRWQQLRQSGRLSPHDPIPEPSSSSLDSGSGRAAS